MPIPVSVQHQLDDFEKVLAAARAGEESAVAVLYDALQPALLGYFRWQEPSLAEDLSSETWIAVATHLPRFNGDEGAFRAWIFAIARRRVADHRRRMARRGTVTVLNEALASPVDAAGPEEEVVERISAQQAVRVLSGTLTPDQAEVVMLRIVGGLSVEETAQVLSKRPGAIRVLQHRALRRLAERLREQSVVDA